MTETWHTELSCLEDYERLEGQNLEDAMENRSDFVKNHYIPEANVKQNDKFISFKQKDYSSLPSLSFDKLNCDLYD